MTAGGEFARVVGAVFKVSDLAHAPILALPLAFSLASVINLLALYFAFMMRIEDFDSSRIVPSLFKINLAAACMAVAVYGGIAYCRTMGEYADVPWCVRARGLRAHCGCGRVWRRVICAASRIFFSRASVFAPGKKNIPFADFPHEHFE